MTNVGSSQTSTSYPGYNKFSDEGGYYINPDDAAYSQFDCFAANKTYGLTKVGLSHVNQTIEAFVCCFLGGQVNTRSSILGFGGRAKTAKTEFLVLMEDAISSELLRLSDLAALSECSG